QGFENAAPPRPACGARVDRPTPATLRTLSVLYDDRHSKEKIKTKGTKKEPPRGDLSGPDGGGTS
ncbi:MAG: hypothetical protein AAFX50_07725, partial [Acidobacteriota bacterium]